MAPSPSTHVIRLRGPWAHDLVTPLADLSPPAGAGSFAASATPASVPASEWIRFRRGFGFPTGLTPADRVELVIEGCGGPGRVWLNDALLGDISATGTASRFPIRDSLQNRNRLVIVVAPRQPLADVQSPVAEIAASPPAFPGEVKLEIHSALLTG